jgi:REP element-mobilizing transposase RayT
MICDAVTECCNLRGYRLYGYCLMPDHLHVLLSPNNSGIPLARWLNTFKTFTSNEFTKRGNTPPLWQRSAHDHVCRTGETAESVLKYIADNPVRAGLVKNWRDWKWTKA